MLKLLNRERMELKHKLFEVIANTTSASRVGNSCWRRFVYHNPTSPFLSTSQPLPTSLFNAPLSSPGLTPQNKIVSFLFRSLFVTSLTLYLPSNPSLPLVSIPIRLLQSSCSFRFLVSFPRLPVLDPETRE